MADQRYKNANWTVGVTPMTFEGAQLAVLMDIRDELQQINRTLGCHRIPRALDAIGRIDRRLQNNGALIGGRRRK